MRTLATLDYEVYCGRRCGSVALAARRILKKLRLNTNVDLVHYAMNHRLIE